jgi:hypothetical protein
MNCKKLKLVTFLNWLRKNKSAKLEYQNKPYMSDLRTMKIGTRHMHQFWAENKLYKY